MDVFSLRQQLINDYAAYVRSFIRIRDERISNHVTQELQNGILWPDPLIQLNPSFEPGRTIDDLVAEGLLHSANRDIFRLHQPDGTSRPLRLHRHQSDAVRAAKTGDSYVLTTGTGSGKSLSYIIPIVEHVLRNGSGKGIRAIIIYPMNALANSQHQELEKFLGPVAGNPPVTFRQYTGQEDDEARQEIRANPPDILLTNYVMLELIMTRPDEQRDIITAARGALQFLVLDELHTYRGRQGADVALLLRRVREICENPALQCVGTSATLAGGRTFANQQEQIATVATRLFGTTVRPARIIGETLRRATAVPVLDDLTFIADLRNRLQNGTQPPVDEHGFRADPLARWIEATLGLTMEAASGRLIRAVPISITGETGAARRLAALTGVAESRCEQAIMAGLMAGYNVRDSETGFPIFAFRLHQFISRGDKVYTSLEGPQERHITTRGQQFVPGTRERILLPVVFCRECGHEYYSVRRYTDPATGGTSYLPRALQEQNLDESAEAGFLCNNLAEAWPQSTDTTSLLERLPDDWTEMRNGQRRIRSNRRRQLPRAVQVHARGLEADGGRLYHFITAPFSFCLNCGVSHSSRQRSDFGKLAELSSEGRSTATTILAIGALRALHGTDTLSPDARKLLSFTDNRQDASLQAGHFNDFVEVGLLRAALYAGVMQAGDAGVTHERLAQIVFDTLNLARPLYAIDPAKKFARAINTDRALREVLAYRIYQDQRRGWRVTSPNLEQCGLLRITYESLDELCLADEEWQGLHPALVGAPPTLRQEVLKTLLDFLRRELAIRVDFLDQTYHEQLRQLSSQELIEPWAIDENEELIHAVNAYPRARAGDRNHVFVSGRSGLGLYLRRIFNQQTYLAGPLNVEQTEHIIIELFRMLHMAGLVEIVHEDTNPDDPAWPRHGYQIPASALIWRGGDGTEPFHDPIRVPRRSDATRQTNPFFIEFYQQVAATLQGFEAREHTAQVPSQERQHREDRFRSAELPILFCSPTMELGVDIAQLNVVNMRNVPPTPANYAQRSGRAGRSGQPALVFTYCTTGSPHDQYFFRRPQQMVAGSVSPPRLDLGNEDLVRAHVYAVWLGEAGLKLGSSLSDLLDVDGDTPTLTLLPSVMSTLQSSTIRRRAAQRMQRILDSMAAELIQVDWYNDEWLARTLAQVEMRFEEACERWRGLYRAARRQRDLQDRIIMDRSRAQNDRNQAKRLRAEAESQIELLMESRNLFQSDFYSYRYFASEGFLPGYNFPRLPLSAYIPGRRQRQHARDEYLNRPRFLAISEFGPRSIIYHEGSRYSVNRVILPVTEHGEQGLVTQSVRLCPRCGYLHTVNDEMDYERCERCDTQLDAPMHSLLRMQNVATRRRERINSDEEERMRQGFDLISGVRFHGQSGQINMRQATVRDAAGHELLHLFYGDTATIWRINRGWRRRREPDQLGFWLDTERGYWSRNELEPETSQEDSISQSRQRVVPFVEDRRNCLLIEPATELDVDMMASLQPALKSAIQILYQLEDNELAAEPLPTRDERRVILLYESAEGGAGVLRQLLDNADAMAQVASEALRVCHFAKDGTDMRQAKGAREECEAACYDCLMSYYNQMDHLLLDRQGIRDYLLRLAGSLVDAAPAPVPREDHTTRLKALCDSDLERKWLDFLEEHGLRLPDEAQPLLEACQTRADFYYREAGVAIYIDGPVHDHANVAENDMRIKDCLTTRGIEMLRFRFDDNWEVICREHSYLFGAVRE